MPSDNCAYCSHDKKKYFAQVISNGKKVVAQRCASCLRSWRGQPFVSTHGFDWNSLPRWDDSKDQLTLKDDGQPKTVEEKAFDMFFPDVRRIPAPQKRLVKGQIGYVPPELPR